jgi:hypothetical protein
VDLNLDFEALVAINIAIQILLALLLVVAIILAKRRMFKYHCTATRIAFIAQILTIIGIMLPAMSFYADASDQLFQSEVLVHHALGLGAIFLWIYVNLVYLKLLKIRRRFPLKMAMQTAAAIWAASLLLGLQIYSRLYI